MRKIIGLLVAVVLVMSLATVAFATTDAGTYDIYDVANLPASITLGAGETATYMISDWSCFGNTMEVVGENATVMVNMWSSASTADSADNKAVVVLEGRRYCQVDITNNGTAAATYTLSVVAPKGTMGNPDTLLLPTGAAELEIVFDFTLSQYEYYYSYTATEAGVLTFSNIKAVDPSNAENAIDDYNVMMSLDGFMNYTESMNEDWTPGSEVSYTLEAGDVLSIYIRVSDYDMGPAAVLTADINMYTAGSQAYPIPVNAIGDYVVEGDEVWFAVNSMLAGNVIVATGENAAIEIDGTVIKAVDGLATAVLNGNGATIAVKVTGADDMIIVPAPTEVNAAGDYTADVAAGAEVEYAINSKLAGAILTVKGEGAYIYMNGTKYNAVDGVAVAVLEGNGAVIAVKIGNASEVAAQYALNIAYAPTEIAAAGDYKVTLAAGTEAEYAVNSKLAGYVVTVKGEGAYLIIGDKKVEAKDGVASATLEGTGATIKLVVGNAGTASAEWTVNVAAVSNDETGDFGVIAAVIALATSAIGGTAVIAKKKEN